MRVARMHTLDGMRGVAALLVALYHFRRRNVEASIPGYLAVDLFFGLSGFVIALNYQDRLAGGLGVGRFAELRIIRLYPLFALSLILGTGKELLKLALHSTAVQEVALVTLTISCNLLLLPAPETEILFPYNPPAWSLLLELQVNLLFALLLWRAPSLVLVGVVAVSLLLLVSLVAPPDYLNVGWKSVNLVAGVARTMVSFLLGVLLFRHLPRGSGNGSWWALAPIAAMALVISTPVPVSIRLAWELACVTLLLPATLALGVRLEPPLPLRRAFAFLGDISYPIYAVHWMVVGLFQPANGASLAARLLAMLLFLLVLAASGSLVLRFFDVPVRRWIGCRLRVRRTAVPTRS